MRLDSDGHRAAPPLSATRGGAAEIQVLTYCDRLGGAFAVRTESEDPLRSILRVLIRLTTIV
jgi:hypothetical protein